jgi:transcriptional regulator with XRE-family HTH domain
VLQFVFIMRQKEFDLKKFADTFNKHRTNERYSLRQIAKILGSTAATLSRIENYRKADIDTVSTICEWMNIPITRFIKSKK